MTGAIFLLWIWDPWGTAMMLTSVIFIYGEHTKFGLQKNYSQALTYNDLVHVTAIDSRIQKDTLLISQIQTEGHKTAPCSCHRYTLKNTNGTLFNFIVHRWWDVDWSTQNDTLFMSQIDWSTRNDTLFMSQIDWSTQNDTLLKSQIDWSTQNDTLFMSQIDWST